MQLPRKSRREEMVHVTERARDMFKERLDHVTDVPDLALRIGATVAGLGVFPDTRKDDDQVIEHEGKTVLLLDRDVSEALADKPIDVVEDTDGARFVLRK
jgi:Fe-S cluster assembly iron-binding protein IscA